MQALRGLMFLIIVAVLVTVYWPSPDPEQVARVEADFERAGAYVATRRFVKSRLRFPEEADFEFGGSRNTVSLGNGRWITTSYVDIKNAFGVVSRKSYRAVVRLESGTWHLETLGMR